MTSVCNSAFVAEYSHPAFTCSKLTIETLEQRCEICSNLSIKLQKRRQWPRFGGFIVNFEHTSHLCSSVSIVNFEHVIAGWVGKHWRNGTSVSNGSIGIHRRCSGEKVFLKSFAIFTDKHVCWSLFIKNRLQYRCFAKNIMKFLRTPYLKNTCEWLSFYPRTCFFARKCITHPAFTCSKLTMETLEQFVKYVES